MKTISRLLLLVMTLLLAADVFTADASLAARLVQKNRTGQAAAGSHLVTNLLLGPDTPNILRSGVDGVYFSFDYVTTQAEGVFITFRPYSQGKPTPGSAADSSPLYPAGAGSGKSSFTVKDGNAVIDTLRIQMVDNTKSIVLFDEFMPVYYVFAPGGDAKTPSVWDISYTIDTPNILTTGMNALLSFAYETGDNKMVFIEATPFTSGEPTPGAAVSAAEVPNGSGKASMSFTLKAAAVVDHLRIQMWDSSQTIRLVDVLLPVYYRFTDSINSITGVALTVDTPNLLAYEHSLNVSFNYFTYVKEGVLIQVQPFSGLKPVKALINPDAIYPVGSGGGMGYFTLLDGPVVVDRLRIQMWDRERTNLFFEDFIPIEIKWPGGNPPAGPDMGVDAIEVTQAIQDLTNSVKLVANKRTYVRVHVSAPSDVLNVYATLTGARGGMALAPILTPLNPGGDITVSASPDRGQINDSYLFELPASWIAPGSLELTFHLDPNNAKFDPNYSNNTLSTTVAFLAEAPLMLRQVNIQYTVGGTTYLANTSHLDALESWLQRAYPINQLIAGRTTFIYPEDGLPVVGTLHSYLAVVKMLMMLFSGEDLRVVYYGVVDDGGGFMRGAAYATPGRVAAGPSGTNTWGWDTDGSYNDWYGGHEIGHTRGRSHAMFCGATDGTAYPYPGGRISPDLAGNKALYGFDITTRAIYPPTWKDVMTYCANEWVSDFTYEGIRTYLNSIGPLAARPAQVSASDFLMVVGQAQLNTHTAVLSDVYKISQASTVELPEPGAWEIVLLNVDNSVLATYSFTPAPLTDTEGSEGNPALIAQVVPWASGTVRLEVRYNGLTVASRSASANAPAVKISGPAVGISVKPGLFDITWDAADKDDNSLTYSVMYSRDAGLTWQVLASDLAKTSLTANTDQLPGGQILLRVIASDGFLTGTDTSGPIPLPLHAPQASIISPAEGAAFYPTQLVSLQATAYDLEDGALGSSAFAWSSDRSGALGNGALLSVDNLLSGPHTLTLTVTDSDGMVTEIKRTIQIMEDPSQEPANLEAAPLGVAATLPYNSPATTYTLTLQSSSGGNLTWKADGAAAWLKLSTDTGDTPTQMSLTIDPNGLHVGTYSTKITFSSLQAANLSTVILVTLQVTGQEIYLPVVSR